MVRICLCYAVKMWRYASFHLNTHKARTQRLALAVCSEVLLQIRMMLFVNTSA